MASNEDEEKLACPVCFKAPEPALCETIIVSMQQQWGARTSKTIFPCKDCFRDRWKELQEHLLSSDTFFQLKEVSCATCGHRFQRERTVIGDPYCSIHCREEAR